MAIVLDGNNLTTTGMINSLTAVNSTSGTSIDFTGIPAGVKRVTVMFDGVSKSSTANFLLQLGTSGGVQTSGYVGNAVAAAATNLVVGVSSTSGFPTAGDAAGTSNIYGSIVFMLLSGTTWVCNGMISLGISGYNTTVGGSKTLGATLDRVRITTTSGTDTFDAGSINVLYE